MALDFDNIATADYQTGTPLKLDWLFGEQTTEMEEIGRMIDPFADREGSNGTSCQPTGRIKYNNGILTRVLYIPSFVVLVITSIFLIYAILKLLRPLLKIYISVLFYAACQLFLALCLIFSLMASNLYNETLTTCALTEPILGAGMILPGYGILSITIVRYLFLRHPLTWRNVLRMPYQIAGFLALVLTALLLPNLPNFGLCGYTLYMQDDITQCRYSDEGSLCTAFYVTYITLGFAVPPVAVTVLYILICRIISRHKAFGKSISECRTSTTRTSSASSTHYRTESSGQVLLNTSSMSTSSRTEKKERSSIPWSVMVILVLNISSTIPWIPQTLYPDLFYGCQPGEMVLLVDVLWSVLIVSAAVSPITYLLTTRSVRGQLRQWMGCIFPQGKKNFQKLTPA